ncbi:hypothetical protein AB0I72_09615 [Nocardiopsis sp. NPDC049922]|uniref:hypothetical protein n=1 Tax=Nocardiopsis sp. NPDC049922 TaxID=3155157 RepID=UPI0033DAA27C
MTTRMCTPTGGVINPSMFPIPTTDPDELEALAGALRTDGETVSDVGADIKSAWAGLTSCYSAPEAAELYAVVDPVATDGDSVQSGMASAATALETFADEVRGIKARWATLTTDANDFLASIEGDDDWRSPDTWSWEWWSGGESPKVAEHQALLDRADQLRQDFEAAEVTCANALNAGIPGRTSFVHGDGGEPGPNEFAHGYDGYLGDVPMAWGGPVETDDAWFVDVGNSVKDFGVGALEDLGGLVGMHSSEGWFQMSWGDALWENYEGAVQGAASLVGMYDSESGDWGWAGWDNVGSAWRDAAHAVVPWEEWGDRPWYVIGTAVLNIGATVGGALLTATGVGAVVGVPLMAWRGSAILGRMGGGRTPDVDLPDGGTPDLAIHLNLPRFAGGARELFSVDLPHLDLAGVSPSRMADMREALDRLVGRYGVGDGATDGAHGPRSDRRYGDGGEDPTTQDLADAVTVEDVLNPASPEATRLRDRYQGEFLENDLRSEGGWEASQTGRNDGPELDREPALLGPRADTGDAAAAPDRPSRRVDLTGDDGLDDLPDHRRNDVDTGDRTPDVTNSVDGADGTRPRDTGDDGPSNGTRTSDPGDGRVDPPSDTGGHGPMPPTPRPVSGLPDDTASETPEPLETPEPTQPSNLKPDHGGPMSPELRDDVRARIQEVPGFRQLRFDAKDFESLFNSLENRRSTVGAQTADMLLGGRLAHVEGFGDMISSLKSRQDLPARNQEMRIATDLLDAGFPAERVAFPGKNPVTGEDLDVAVRGEDGRIEYGYQAKVVDNPEGIRSALRKIRKQFPATSEATHRGGIIEANFEMGKLLDRDLRALHDAARADGISFHIHFLDGTLDFPPGTPLYPTN